MSDMGAPPWEAQCMVKKDGQYVSVPKSYLPRWLANGWALMGCDRGRTKEEWDASCVRLRRIRALEAANPERSLDDILFEVDGRRPDPPQGFSAPCVPTEETFRLIAAIKASLARSRR